MIMHCTCQALCLNDSNCKDLVNCPKGIGHTTHLHIMRKIESQMNAAILNNENWQKDNTSVIYDPDTNNNQSIPS